MEDRLIAVFLRIVNNSAAACWIILLVLVLRLLFHRAPGQVRMALWSVVGLRLILPFSLEAVWSLIPSAELISRETIYASSPALADGTGPVSGLCGGRSLPAHGGLFPDGSHCRNRRGWRSPGNGGIQHLGNRKLSGALWRETAMLL